MLWEKNGDAKDNSDLIKVDLPAPAITEPTVVIISGWPVNDKNRTVISKEISALKKLLAGHVDPKIYCWAHESALAATFDTFAYNRAPAHRTTDAARNFAQGIIMPLVSDKGRPLPPGEAKEKLRNLTLYTFCAGTIAAQEIYNASLQMMKDIGYREEEAAELLHKIADIAVAPTSRPWQETDRFSTLAIMASDDGMIKLIHPLRGLFHKAGQRLKADKLSETSVLVTAAARREIWQWGKKEVIEGVWLPGWSPISHALPDYINAQDTSSQFSRIVQHALINAINRKTTDKPEELLKAPATVEAAIRDIYERRIEQAFSK